VDSDGDGVGDLAGLTRRLDYLSGLGITTLWMMPFYPSPLGDDGYDITDYYAVDPRFGTLGDFVEMIRTAGNLGIRVLVDLVLNHTSNQHPWFQQARRDRSSRYAPEPEHRVYGRGIRRRLAPMLGNDMRRIRLALALTTALPGTPVLMYGDEIGMGEKTVNVLGQRHHPDSLYSWVAHAIRVRRERPELGWGQWRTLDVGDPRVLAIENRWRGGHLVALHNLSAEPALIRLPADGTGDGQSGEVRQVLGGDPSAPVTGQDIPVDGYGFRWLRLPGENAML
jgi:glycosidase